MTHHWLYLFYLFPLVGLGMLYGGFNLLTKYRKIRNEWLRLEASVIELVKESSDDGFVYRAHYQYDCRGKQYTGKHGVASSPAAFKIGDSVKVFVNPEAPGESMLDHWFYLGPFALLFLGTTFLIGGSVFSYLIAAGKLN